MATNLQKDDIEWLSEKEKVQKLLQALPSTPQDGLNTGLKVIYNSTTQKVEIWNFCKNSWQPVIYSSYVDINGYPHLVLDTNPTALKAQCTAPGRLSADPVNAYLYLRRKYDIALVPAKNGEYDALTGVKNENGTLYLVTTYWTPQDVKVYVRENTKIVGNSLLLNKDALLDILNAVKQSCGW